MVLSSAALAHRENTPRSTERGGLRRDLREMKDAIDRYKDAADETRIRVRWQRGYPPDLETLVKGVQLGASSDRKIRFLRKIPIDPMTGRADWDCGAVQDDPGIPRAGAARTCSIVFEVDRNGAGWNKVFRLVVLNGELNENAVANLGWWVIAT